MVPVAGRSAQKICFIAGAGHSGSTLLGLVLGSHSQGFYGGEMAKSRFLQNPQKVLRKRVCKLCGPDCPVWGDFQVQGQPDLYEQVARRVHKPLIIDSSKNLDWLGQQMATLDSTDAEIFLIFLQRDGRAVVNSRLRKYPDRPLETLVHNWMTQIETTQAFFAAAPVKKRVLRYEVLASEPEATVAELCQFLDLPPELAMVNYTQAEHHVLGGNNGTQFLVAKHQDYDHSFVQLSQRNKTYYQNHGSQIRLDRRWQQELPPAALDYFTKTAGSLNQAFAWD